MVRGMNEEIRPAKFYGHQLDRPMMEVWDEFAPIRIPVSWDMVRAVANGQRTEYQMRAFRPPYKNLEN